MPARPAVYFDCTSGASGDMLLAALLDLTDARQTLRVLLRALGLPATTMRLRRVAVRSLAGWQCRVAVQPRHERTLTPFIDRVRRSRLPARVKRVGARILMRLAQAERRVHRGTVHAHHVHEIGRIDTVIAAAGCAFVLQRLGVARVFVGPLPLGYGWIRAEEGLLPNPGPAVLELLRGFPVTMTRLRQELVTPTAAAILSTIAHPMPPRRPFTVERIGYGVGTKRIAGTPGTVRACVLRPGRSVERNA